MIRFLIYIILFLFPFAAYSAVTETTEDVSEEEERTAPVIEDASPEALASVSIPSFINKRANSIIYNNADWSTLYTNIANLKHSNGNADNVVMLHVGDSHIQADIATRRVREQLQRSYGNAGRGLIIPFKLAKTNEPVDYRIISNSNLSYATLLRKPWNVEVGFTGVALHPSDKVFDLTISTLSTQAGESAFDVVKIYHDNEIGIDKIMLDGEIVENNSFSDIGGTVITLPRESTSVEVKISYAQNAPRIFGVELSRGSNGIVYNTIGNNGATYSHYNQLNDFGKWASLLTPQLVIISLGCNEAFGNTTDDLFYKDIDRLVRTIKREIPEALIMLTTPMECQRAKISYRRSGRKKKKRIKVRRYIVNSKIAMLRNVILRYGKNNNVAVWDWYDVAGGAGASHDWSSNNLLSRDRIHNTGAGYHLQGELLFEALTKDIKQDR